MFQFEGMFQWIVGNYKEMEVSFDIDKDKNPYHAKPYRIPIAHISLMKKTINEMVENKALTKYTGNSEWKAPTFGVPKNIGGIRIVTDFRRLNETTPPV